MLKQRRPLKDHDINTLFKPTHPVFYSPFDLTKLPTLKLKNPTAQTAYQTIMNRLRRWNQVDCLKNTSQLLHCSKILERIYEEMVLMSNSTSVRQEATVVRLEQMMAAFNVEVKTMREWRPKVEPEVEHQVTEKNPFYIRSRFSNLSNNQTILRLVSLEINSKNERDKVSSRKMRIYGKGHTKLADNIEKDGDSRRLFRDWLFKEKCRQFFTMVIFGQLQTDSEWNRKKSKKCYTKVAVSEYVSGEGRAKRASLGEKLLKVRNLPSTEA